VDANGTTSGVGVLDKATSLLLALEAGPASLTDLCERTRLARATVTAAPFRTSTFDIVTSFDVIYSLESADERAAIAEMYRMLKPGGFAIVNVAAMEILRGDHSVLSRERRRYSRDQLRARLSEAGFEIVRITYTNATLFLPMAIVRALQRMRGLKAEGESKREITVPPKAVNGLLSIVMALESLWLRKFDQPFGSSLLCLARKPSRPYRVPSGLRAGRSNLALEDPQTQTPSVGTPSQAPIRGHIRLIRLQNDVAALGADWDVDREV